MRVGGRQRASSQNAAQADIHIFDNSSKTTIPAAAGIVGFGVCRAQPQA
jgi:hypothetical protein